MGYLGPASQPFEIMSLDTVGGFGGRRSTKRYLHILVDHFTRYAFISATAGQSTSDFIKIIDSVQKENQIGTLLTDQYGAFGSDEFADYLENSNINHLFTGVNVPTSNGLNERLNQTLCNRIRCRSNDPVFNPSNAAWATIAHKCTFEYNNTPHSVTTFAPHYLLYGTLPISFAPSSPINISSLQSDREIAFQHSLIAHNLNKERLDKRLKKTTPFKTGQLVYIENGNKLNRHKLDQIRIQKDLFQSKKYSVNQFTRLPLALKLATFIFQKYFHIGHQRRTWILRVTRVYLALFRRILIHGA
jgi:hypothetical protein